ncbi:cytoplasmic dynein 2 intermediate chain 2-like isoform X2 [Rhopilema esculentum]|uniref:cytoplasmic dynein 2 intermediate chain 2-like isoform X2 n=1 Tax=Rhopilema esculentum TaxID=499914 RepID=UPI0031D995B6
MFSDETHDVISLPSSWKVERSLNDASCQTKDITFSIASTQSSYKNEIEIQTETDEDESLTKSKQLDVNTQALSNFLLRVYPDICEQLIANEKSHAFDGYDVNWEDETDTISCLYKLSHKAASEDLEVTSVSWNSRGSVIAAAYGRHDHESWCTHKSLLCTWNIDMRNIDTEKGDKALEVDGCLMSIAFHPTNPPLIAGGTFNGEVVVWDLSQDDDNALVASSRQIELHQEPVTKVTWMKAKGRLKSWTYEIMSISSDGKAFLWRYDQYGKKLKLERGFLVLAEKIPKSLVPSKIRSDAEMGVTCMSFAKDDPDIFVIGSEGGGLFKCYLDSEDVTSKGTAGTRVYLRSPVTLAYAPHIGPVYSVDCSPFHRNVFISCSMDTTVNIFSMLQIKPLYTIEPGAGYLLHAQWSQSRPLVFFLTTENGKLLIYDLKVSQIKPTNVIDVSSTKKAVYAIDLNPQRSKLIATGDADGCVSVWSLNDDLVTFDQKEVSSLDGMVSAMLE